MEFKQKLTKKKKANRAKRLKARGLKRIVVRGRKRWLNPDKESAA